MSLDCENLFHTQRVTRQISGYRLQSYIRRKFHDGHRLLTSGLKVTTWIVLLSTLKFDRHIRKYALEGALAPSVSAKSLLVQRTQLASLAPLRHAPPRRRLSNPSVARNFRSVSRAPVASVCADTHFDQSPGNPLPSTDC